MLASSRWAATGAGMPTAERGAIPSAPALAQRPVYRPHVGDRSNPRGPVWAVVGASFWRRAFPRSIVSPIIAAAYSDEASWGFHNKYPLASFFRDVAMLDPATAGAVRHAG